MLWIWLITIFKMCLPCCIRSVHTASSVLHYLLNHTPLSGAYGCIQHTKIPRMMGSPSTPLPWSLPTFQAIVPSGLEEARLPLSLDSIHKFKQRAREIFLWASFIDLVSSHAKPSSGEQFEQKVSYCILSPTDGGPIKRLPRHLPSVWSSPSPWIRLHFCHGAPVTMPLTLRMYPNGQVAENWKEIHSLHIISKSSIRCGASLFLPGM